METIKTGRQYEIREFKDDVLGDHKNMWHGKECPAPIGKRNGTNLYRAWGIWFKGADDNWGSEGLIQSRWFATRDAAEKEFAAMEAESAAAAMKAESAAAAMDGDYDFE
jgi:hypothetical protein